jgi:hypothetical protein
MVNKVRNLLCAALLCCTAIGIVGTAPNRASAKNVGKGGHGWDVSFVIQAPGKQPKHLIYYFNYYSQAASNAQTLENTNGSGGVRVWAIEVLDKDG